MHRRVVITGMGAITPLGNDVRAFFTNLVTGQTGVQGITRFDVSRCPMKKAAEIKAFDPRAFDLSTRDIRVLERFQQYALAAAEMAVRDAGLDLPRQEIRGSKRTGVQLDRYGAAIGVAFPGTEALARNFAKLWKKGTKGVSPHIFNKTLPNSATSAVSIRFALSGPLITVSGASAAGTESVIAAYEKIKYGRAEVMLAGGSEEGVTEIIVSGFSQNQTGSKSGMCRPFDKRRDGTVLGEGAAVIVLEELQHAKSRNARVYGEILGYGLRSDAYDLTDIPPVQAPGMTACLSEAVRDANLAASEVHYVNAHGTATRMNDLAETNAIKTVFGEHAYSLCVSGIKGSVGHMLGAVGAAELIAATLATCFDYVPPTYGLEMSDPQCDLNYVPGQGVRTPCDIAVSTSSGMGGGNSAIIVRGRKLNWTDWTPKAPNWPSGDEQNAIRQRNDRGVEAVS